MADSSIGYDQPLEREVEIATDLAAGVHTLKVVVAGEVAAVGSGKELKRVPIDEATLGDQEVIAAVATKSLYVVSYALVAAGAVTLIWKSGATALSGPLALAANGQLGLAGDVAAPLLWTAAGEALNLNLSAAVAVGGHLTYFEE